MYRDGKNLSSVLGQRVSQQGDDISDNPAFYIIVLEFDMVLQWCIAQPC